MRMTINTILFRALVIFYFVRHRCRGHGGRTVLPSHGSGAREDRLQAAGGSSRYITCRDPRGAQGGGGGG
jgi:hypothetical protein